MRSVVLLLAVFCCYVWPSFEEEIWYPIFNATASNFTAWRTVHPLVSIGNGTVLMLGGCTDSVACPSSHGNEVWQSNDDGANWSQHNGSVAWGQRQFHSGVVSGSTILVMGGRAFGQPGIAHLNDVWAIPTDGSTWTLQTASAEWDQRINFGIVSLTNGTLVLMGGFAQFMSKNDVWSSDDLGVTWRRLVEEAEWTARYDFAVVVLSDNTIVLMGGTAPSDKNDVWISRDNGTSWILQTPFAQWSPRSNHQAVVLDDDTILLMGGRSLREGPCSDVWRGFHYGMMWTPVSAVSSWPGGGDFYVAITSGQKLVLADGNGGNGVVVWTNSKSFTTSTTSTTITTTTTTTNSTTTSTTSSSTSSTLNSSTTTATTSSNTTSSSNTTESSTTTSSIPTYSSTTDSESISVATTLAQTIVAIINLTTIQSTLTTNLMIAASISTTSQLDQSMPISVATTAALASEAPGTTTTTTNRNFLSQSLGASTVGKITIAREPEDSDVGSLMVGILVAVLTISVLAGGVILALWSLRRARVKTAPAHFFNLYSAS